MPDTGAQPNTEPFFNTICGLIAVSGDPSDSAPYSGITAQMSAFSEMLPEMTKEEAEKLAPELRELRYEQLKKDIETTNIEGTARTPITDEQMGQVLDGVNTYHKTDTTPLFPPITTRNIDADGNAGISREINAGAAAGALFKTVTEYEEPIAALLAKLAPFLTKAVTAVTSMSPLAAKAVASVTAIAAVAAPWLSAGSNVITDTLKIVGDFAEMISYFLMQYQQLSQFKNMAQYLRYFAPSSNQVLDALEEIDTFIEQSGDQQPRAIPHEEEAKSRDASTGTGTGTGDTGTGTGTGDTPTNPTTPTSTVVKRIKRPNFGEFTTQDAIRYLCRELSIFETEVKKLNLNLQGKITPAGKSATTLGLGQVLANTLYFQKTFPEGLSKPYELWTLAEILAKGIPVIQYKDPASMKMKEISVLELLMQAQQTGAEIEIGSGFLKWLPYENAIISRVDGETLKPSTE